MKTPRGLVVGLLPNEETAAPAAPATVESASAKQEQGQTRRTNSAKPAPIRRK